ncbi:MAG: hypothetical protein RMZ69_21595 [Nostoc sp. ChiQUE01a]|nr:hypothetical protein [Nostoc sp. ChiQUE01a]
MTQNNLEQNLETSQPDPAWDYYPLWHSLHHIKAKIDKALEILKEEEFESDEAERDIRHILGPVSNKLIEIVDNLPADDEE